MPELILILQTLTNVYVSLFLTRLWAGVVGADFRNPLLIAVVRYTSPILRPLRRLIPPVGRWDMALITIILALEFVLQCVIRILTLGIFSLNFKLLLIAGLESIDLALSLGLLFCIGFAALSWLVPDDPYLPAARCLNDLLAPLLRPIRRALPNTPGIDFSPMVLMLAIWILRVTFNARLYPYLWGVG